ncbi:MAG: SET domain-containing protein [Thermodesulfobacteriota bacterium]
MKRNIYVSESSIGKGVFAGQDFAPGDLILILRGKKFKWGDPIHYTDYGAYLIQTGYKSYILPDNPGVFLNHSCKPNAGIHNNRRLIAISKISKGEEIAFDYSTTMDENFWTLDCMCNSPECRGKITDFKLLPSEFQTRYIMLNVVQRFIVSRFKAW